MAGSAVVVASRRSDAERAAIKLEQQSAAGKLADAARGKLTFAAYVEQYYWPAAQHLEPTTLAAYRSNLGSHFLPSLGRMRMSRIVASTVQAWVDEVSAEVEDYDGTPRPRLSPRSVRKYDTFLHAIFERAIIDQGRHDQPVRAHGAAEIREATEEGDQARAVRDPARRDPAALPHPRATAANSWIADVPLPHRRFPVTTVPVEVDDELLRLADAQAAEAGRPRSEVLAAALRRGLGGGQLSRIFAEARKGPVLSEDEAMELAKSELAAMRAERRGV